MKNNSENASVENIKAEEADDSAELLAT